MLRYLRDSWGLLFPNFCSLCRRPIRCGRICRRCSQLLTPTDSYGRCEYCFSAATEVDGSGRCTLCRLYPSPIRRIRYLWEYESLARDLIAIFKYRPSLALCREAARRAASALSSLFPNPDFDLILPIPPSSGALMTRGFSPCNELCGVIAGPLSVSTDFSALWHTRRKKTQAALSHQQRLRNVHDSFGASHNRCAGKRILLVDDVMTTGATCTAAATALLDAGAICIDVFALARASAFLAYRAKLAAITSAENKDVALRQLHIQPQ